MQLKILLPSHIFATLDEVSSIVVDTVAGSLDIVPHRLDCVATVLPGILTYTQGGGTNH